ncbi:MULTISPECIES: IclR family transcriptional regulator [Halomonadaceae]|uniref:IclR family transcriptional regulator n=1 Tax=Halomonadaceae TaxID=28256 RepID=UPI00159A9014|nr:MULTISPECIES: IclR family transcriptional regulator [Halomonas]QJQ94189.1 IclR family transcriptional regulator [Halomonas sp. PA5]
MARSLIERTLGVLEALSSDARGLPLQSIAERLEIPKSAAHRICNELIRLGYVRQDPASHYYLLSTRLMAMGFHYMAISGTSDIVQPILDHLAAESGEMVRLGVIEGNRQIWIAKAQGARSGLRYDPDMGREAPLNYTASGHAWLASLSDEEAIDLVEAQGVGNPDDYGPNAVRSHAELLERLEQARTNGYSWQVDNAAAGTSALAAVVRHPRDGHVIGVLSIAGPSVRLTKTQMHTLAPLLLNAAAELSQTSQASKVFS